MGRNNHLRAPDLELDALGRTLNTSHAECGKSWHQSGERTSHCGGCHQTLSNLSLFDAHRNLDKDAPAGTKRACQDLATMAYHGHPLEMDAGGIWFSPTDRAKSEAYWEAHPKVANPDLSEVG